MSSIFTRLFRKKITEVDYDRLPVHIAIIMDGNGRWARKRGLPRTAGHRAGSQNLKKLTEFCDRIGIRYLTVYAFSAENWSRPKDEVDALMNLLLEYLRQYRVEAQQKNIKMQVIGDTSALSEEIRKEINEIQKLTKDKTGLTLNIALNYGGRDEIVRACRNICSDVSAGRLKIGDINEKLFGEYLYTKGMPDPDLVIRSSGELRISNFLLWQSSYSEFCFSSIYWPDFSENHLLEAILDYQDRNRRFGGI